MPYNLLRCIYLIQAQGGGSVWGELLRTVLTYKLGLRPWFDVDALSGGEWKPQVDDAISKSQYVIAIFYNGWEDDLEENLDNDEFVHELDEANKNGCKIVPFFAGDYSYNQLENSQDAPELVKQLFCGKGSHNSVVQYCHTTVGQTYKKLARQLRETCLELNFINSDCRIISVSANDSEIQPNKIKGATIEIKRDFQGVIKIIIRKLDGREKEDTVALRIGIRKKRKQYDSNECHTYWTKEDIDMDIDDPMEDANPLHHIIPFDWDSFQKETPADQFSTKARNMADYELGRLRPDAYARKALMRIELPDKY